MNCKKCNSPLPEGSKFCSKCGEQFETETVIEEVEKLEVEPEINQIPVVEKKKSKAPLIIGIVAGLLIIGILIFILVKIVLPSSVNNASAANGQNISDNKEYMVIGNKDYGYLELPGTWYKFKDVEENDALQYTKDSVWIVSLTTIDTTYNQTAENIANAALYNKQYGTEEVEDATIAKTKVASYDAYEVYGYYPYDNIWLVEWFFEPGDGKIHYISLEGPEYNEIYFNIPDSFSLTKIN